MASFEVEDDGIPGLTLALRLRLKGHDVALTEGSRLFHGPSAFTLPAPYRDLFLKSGAALDDVAAIEGAPGRRITIDDVTIELPGVGAQAPAIAAALGPAAAAEWAALLRAAADIWGTLRSGHYVSRGRLQAVARRHLHDRRLRHLLAGYVVEAGLDPAHIGDAAAVLPYLEQTFGRWQFVNGVAAFEAALRERCVGLGVTATGNGGTSLDVESFWAPHFAVPPRAPWTRRRHAPASTRALGLPWIGMAAEAMADGIGRAGSSRSDVSGARPRRP